MKIKELREKNIEELKKLLTEKEELVRKLRFDLVAKQFKGVRQIREAKKTVAQILTILNQK